MSKAPRHEVLLTVCSRDMARCIYCLKDGTSVSFTKREHVIPSAFGSFAPLNPTLTAQDGLVCDECNGNIFGPLETVFIEDTYEGIYGQRLNLQNRNSVTIRGNHFKIKQVSGLSELFSNFFFFLEPKDGKISMALKDQIILRRKQGGYRIFRPEALEAIRKDTSAFNKIAADLKKLDQKDMYIFAENREGIDRIIGLLKTFGVDYKEKDSFQHLFKPGDRVIVEEDYNCTINIDLARVLAKIAFNYFAYCALQSGQKEILYASNFDKIRNFAHSGSGVSGLREIIPSISEECILLEERDSKKRVVAHIINFRVEDGMIIARLTFFGLPAIYKIVIGKVPASLVDNRFGCGHVFNPFDHQIANISQTRPAAQPTAEQIRISFGLMKRI